MENFQSNHNSPASDNRRWGHEDKPEQQTSQTKRILGLSEANDGSCYKPGNPSNALPPQCPMPNSQFPKTQLLIYLIPVIGFFPSLWTLYRRQGSREQLAASRLSITLAFTWFLGYLLLATGAETSDFFALRLLILNSFLTSGYFLVSIWLIFRLIQGKSHRLPGFSRFAERVLDKYLS